MTRPKTTLTQTLAVRAHVDGRFTRQGMIRTYWVRDYTYDREGRVVKIGPERKVPAAEYNRSL
jgi:hypothetical protein